MSFGVNLSTTADATHVEMHGELDEEAQLPRFTESPRHLVIDLGGVNLINSMGCRRWVTWIAAVAKDAVEIKLERCSHAVIQQLNILGGFLPPNARVTSFFVPYECARCGHGARVLHQCDHTFSTDAVPEHLVCAACGGEMNLEVVRPAYFRFIARSA